MSGVATTEVSARPPGSRATNAAGQPVTVRRSIASEWIKFRSLRSTIAVLVAAVVGMFVIALIVAYNTRHLSTSLDANDIVPSSTMQGYYLGQLLIGALGVLFVTGEYSTGMIRSTFAAVPSRLPVLWAKLVVFVTVTLTSMVAICLVAFVSAQGLISHYRVGFSLADAGALRVVIGTGVYLTLIGILGAMLGWIVRSTPGALVAYIAVILVLPILFGSVLGTWGKDVAKFMPSNAGSAFISSIPESPSVSPWTGIAVLALWVLAGIGIAALLVRRRDA